MYLEQPAETVAVRVNFLREALPRRKSMEKWEYWWEINPGSDDGDIIEVLNGLGQDGWELVTVSPWGKANVDTVFFFKRRVA
jgi:hypothetical protein